MTNAVVPSARCTTALSTSRDGTPPTREGTSIGRWPCSTKVPSQIVCCCFGSGNRIGSPDSNMRRPYAPRTPCGQGSGAARFAGVFVLLLTYVKPLPEVDRLMRRHVAWLDEHYAAGRFLVSGRRIPRTGGVIVARGD